MLFLKQMTKRQVGVFLLLCFIQNLFYLCSMEWMIHKSAVAGISFISNHMIYGTVTILMLVAIELVICHLWNPLFASSITSVFWAVWGVANYFKFDMRQEYVTFNDVQLFVSGEVEFAKGDLNFSKHLIVPIIVCVGAFAFGIGSYIIWKKYKYSWKKRMVGVIVFSLVGVVLWGFVYCTESLNDFLLESDEQVKKFGLVLSFVPGNTEPHILGKEDFKPYIKEQKEGNNTEVKPNVIVIMSESMYDTDRFTNVRANKDPMDVIHRYQKKYGGGEVGVNIFGGGTANTEFEFLTGISMKYFNTKLMYNYYMRSAQPALPWYFQALGYKSIAIHPYKKDFFYRDTVYPNLGFENFYSLENMKYTNEKFDITVADSELTNEIIYRYEQNKREQKEQPLFCFGVSVGNHKPCLEYTSGHPYTYIQKVSIEPKDGTYFTSDTRGDVTRYYSGCYDANEALESLIQYFEKKEPTVILFFGDHAPPFSEQAYDEITQQPLTKEQKYTTPMVVWNNYGLEKLDVTKTNANYLSTVLLQYMNFPLPKQCRFLETMMEENPLDIRTCTLDAAGNNTKKRSQSKEEIKRAKAQLTLYKKELKHSKDTAGMWDLP